MPMETSYKRFYILIAYGLDENGLVKFKLERGERGVARRWDNKDDAQAYIDAVMKNKASITKMVIVSKTITFQHDGPITIDFADKIELL